jgi:hypothetical protein
MFLSQWTTIAFFFFSAPFASSSSDEATSSLLFNSLLSRQEEAYPLLLADISDEVPGDYEFFDSETALPNYCRIEDDFACYK